MSENDLAKILVLNDPGQAELLRGLLEAQGINVMLSKEGAATAYGLTVGAFSEIEVFVPRSQYDMAKPIVDEFLHPSESEKEED
jgi:hypothetical protein